MKEILFASASFLIAAFAFGYGVFRLFRKKIPLYLQLYVCAAGCFALERLSAAVNLWCGVYEPFSIGMLGIFGCNFFLLSANFGTLDKIVDDGTDSRKARTSAIAAPIAMALLLLGVFLAWKKTELFGAFLWIFLLLPILPASYFNLKHLLLPPDPFGFLKATRACNDSALCFSVIEALCGAFSAGGGSVLSSVFPILASLSAAALTISAVKGAKKWGI